MYTYNNKEDMTRQNFIMPKGLAEKFDTVTKMTGVKKQVIVQQAIEQYCSQFEDEGGGFNPRPARLTRVTRQNSDGTFDYAEVSCMYLRQTIKCNAPYAVVFVNGQVQQVPAKDVTIL